jgi:putative hydrolase of the HAD superfamily
MQNLVKAALFDFGGVIAEEGFLEGLRVIGEGNGLEPDAFFQVVDSLIYETGYLTGTADEASFWKAVKARTGISGGEDALRREIVTRFVLRPGMLAAVDFLRTKGMTVAMLSDQTNWLEEIDQVTGLFRHFDRIFNSYRIHKSKRDASVFADVCAALGRKPEETLFIDDNINHIKRAQSLGLFTIHFTSVEDFEKRLKGLFV